MKRSKSFVFMVDSGASEMMAQAAIMQSAWEPRRRPDLLNKADAVSAIGLVKSRIRSSSAASVILI